MCARPGAQIAIEQHLAPPQQRQRQRAPAQQARHGWPQPALTDQVSRDGENQQPVGVMDDDVEPVAVEVDPTAEQAVEQRGEEDGQPQRAGQQHPAAVTAQAEPRRAKEHLQRDDEEEGPRATAPATQSMIAAHVEREEVKKTPDQFFDRRRSANTLVVQIRL